MRCRSVAFGGFIGIATVVSFVIKIIGTIRATVAVHIVVLVRWIAMVVVIFARILVGMTTVCICSTGMGGCREKEGRHHKDSGSQKNDVLFAHATHPASCSLSQTGLQS